MQKGAASEEGVGRRVPKVLGCGPGCAEGNGIRRKKAEDVPKLWHEEYRAALSHGIVNQC